MDLASQARAGRPRVVLSSHRFRLSPRASPSTGAPVWAFVVCVSAMHALLVVLAGVFDAAPPAATSTPAAPPAPAAALPAASPQPPDEPPPVIAFPGQYAPRPTGEKYAPAPKSCRPLTDPAERAACLDHVAFDFGRFD